MKFPTRKQIRLDSYDYSQIGSYFITICTEKRARLFAMENSMFMKTGESKMQNQILRKWVDGCMARFSNISIDRYIIMSDHVHLLITIKEQISDVSIPDVVGFFKSHTTNDYITGVKTGHLKPFCKKLWQKSYYDHVVRDQRDYNEIWQYIVNNPMKWKVVHGLE